MGVQVALLRGINVGGKHKLPMKELVPLFEARFGFTVPIVTRSAAELAAAADAMPFEVSSDEPKFFHVGFLDGTPDPGRVAALDPDRSPPDRFEVLGREIYVHYPDGGARSKLTNAWFESRLGLSCTARNWNTVRKLLKMCE